MTATNVQQGPMRIRPVALAAAIAIAAASGGITGFGLASLRQASDRLSVPAAPVANPTAVAPLASGGAALAPLPGRVLVQSVGREVPESAVLLDGWSRGANPAIPVATVPPLPACGPSVLTMDRPSVFGPTCQIVPGSAESRSNLDQPQRPRLPSTADQPPPAHE